jgi:hypothetical protein
LALFALVVQITVTLSHLHLNGSGHATQAAVANQVGTPLAKAHTNRQTPNGGTDLDCPICTLIQLASSSVPSVAPPLPIPVMLSGTISQTPEAPDVAGSPTFAFQARGPPAV